MISEETWDKFKDGKVALRCPNVDVWRLLVEFTGEKYTDIHQENWERYKWDTCAYMNCNSLCYGSRGNGSIEIVDLTEDDFGKSPVPTDSPQPPQELIDILHAIATCESIEKTYDIQLELDGLYDKREKYLEEWTSKFEVHL